jgi:hypothetical protein
VRALYDRLLGRNTDPRPGELAPLNGNRGYS